MDLAAFESKYGFKKPDPASDVVITHCMMGGRAGRAAKALNDFGYTKAEAYAGSMKDWKANGGPTEKDTA